MGEQSRKRQSAITWLAARPRRLIAGIILMQMLYVGSFGPACWLTSRRQARFECPTAMVIYWPLGRVFEAMQTERQRSDNPFNRIAFGVMTWWMTVGLPNGKSAIFRTGPSAHDITVIEPPARYF
jgi:hypothetical protein